jgi:hypothetical protein
MGCDPGSGWEGNIPGAKARICGETFLPGLKSGPISEATAGAKKRQEQKKKQIPCGNDNKKATARTKANTEILAVPE